MLARTIHEISLLTYPYEVILVTERNNHHMIHAGQQMGTILEFQDKSPLLFHGRTKGAIKAKGEVLVFMNEHDFLSTATIARMTAEILSGRTVIFELPPIQNVIRGIDLAKRALNSILQPSLKSASMLDVPYGMHRSTFNNVTAASLANPALALAKTIFKGFPVQVYPFYDVQVSELLKVNQLNELHSVIVGDHLEAIHWITLHTNQRGNKTDLERKREVIHQ